MSTENEIGDITRALTGDAEVTIRLGESYSLSQGVLTTARITLGTATIGPLLVAPQSPTGDPGSRADLLRVLASLIDSHPAVIVQEAPDG